MCLRLPPKNRAKKDPELSTSIHLLIDILARDRAAPHLGPNPRGPQGLYPPPHPIIKKDEFSRQIINCAKKTLPAL